MLRNILFLVCLLFLFGCSKEELPSPACTETLLEQLDMIPYDGQEIGCGFFLELYLFENQYYYLLGNPCIDMVQYPVDCQGDPDPAQVSGAWYLDFFESAQNLGVIGFTP